MDRRKFLGALGAIAAAAVAAPAMAVVSDSPVAVTVNKHKEALRLFDRCVAVASDRKEVCQRFDTLLEYLHTNFPVPENTPEAHAVVAKIVKGQYTIAEMRRIPPVVADSLYPVLLAKMALTSYKMELDPTRMPQFGEFHNRYGQLIVNNMA